MSYGGSRVRVSFDKVTNLKSLPSPASLIFLYVMELSIDTLFRRSIKDKSFVPLILHRSSIMRERKILQTDYQCACISSGPPNITLVPRFLVSVKLWRIFRTVLRRETDRNPIHKSSSWIPDFLSGLRWMTLRDTETSYSLSSEVGRSSRFRSILSS